MRLKLVLPLGLHGDRWQHDRQAIFAKARTLGVEITLSPTSSSIPTQASGAGDQFFKDVDALLVISSPTLNLLPIAELSRKAGVPVVAYDRLIADCPLDYYVSFDNVKVGKLQAEHLLDRRPKGNYALIEGPPSDANSALFRQGQQAVLKPFLDHGDIRIVFEAEGKDWVPSEGLRLVREALEKSGGKLDAILAAYDGYAEGAVMALAEKSLEGKVPVTGQDAELAACQRIMAGTQTMTVYKPIKLLADAAVEAAVAVAQKKPVPGTTTVYNGWGNVPCRLLAPVLVDKGNLEETVLADGFHKRDDIFPS